MCVLLTIRIRFCCRLRISEVSYDWIDVLWGWIQIQIENLAGKIGQYQIIGIACLAWWIEYSKARLSVQYQGGASWSSWENGVQADSCSYSQISCWSNFLLGNQVYPTVDTQILNFAIVLDLICWSLPRFWACGSQMACWASWWRQVSTIILLTMWLIYNPETVMRLEWYSMDDTLLLLSILNIEIDVCESLCLLSLSGISAMMSKETECPAFYNQLCISSGVDSILCQVHCIPIAE